MDRMLEAYTERFTTQNFVDSARLYQSARVERAEYVGSAIGAGIATLTRAVKNLAGDFAEWRAKRQAEAELAQLDDRMLADLGLSRSQISAAIDGRVQRVRPAANENLAVRHNHTAANAA